MQWIEKIKYVLVCKSVIKMIIMNRINEVCYLVRWVDSPFYNFLGLVISQSFDPLSGYLRGQKKILLCWTIPRKSEVPILWFCCTGRTYDRNANQSNNTIYPIYHYIFNYIHIMNFVIYFLWNSIPIALSLYSELYQDFIHAFCPVTWPSILIVSHKIGS